MGSSKVKSGLLLAVKLFVIFEGFQSCDCNSLLINVGYSGNVSKYISTLIKIETSKNLNKNRNVVLIRSEYYKKSVVFGAIANEILNNNPENSVSICSCRIQIEPYKIHASSFIIVTTDNLDEVSERQNYFVAIYWHRFFSHHTEYLLRKSEGNSFISLD